jgi:hypothetical protein
MSTRRTFVKKSMGTAAGMTVVGTLIAEQADADFVSASASPPVVAYVHDAAKGEVALMRGTHGVVVQDRKLAARLARAAG